MAGVRFNIYKDSNTAYKELDAGSLDCSLVPITATKQAKDSYGESEDGYTATPDHQFLGGAMLYTQFLAFNVNDPVMSDVRVRQALSLAINRQAICDAIYEGSAQPADDILPSSMEGYREGAWAYAAYDPRQGRPAARRGGLCRRRQRQAQPLVQVHDQRRQHAGRVPVHAGRLAEAWHRR